MDSSGPIYTTFDEINNRVTDDMDRAYIAEVTDLITLEKTKTILGIVTSKRLVKDKKTMFFTNPNGTIVLSQIKPDLIGVTYYDTNLQPIKRDVVACLTSDVIERMDSSAMYDMFNKVSEVKTEMKTPEMAQAIEEEKPNLMGKLNELKGKVKNAAEYLKGTASEFLNSPASQMALNQAEQVKQLAIDQGNRAKQAAKDALAVGLTKGLDWLNRKGGKRRTSKPSKKNKHKTTRRR